MVICPLLVIVAVDITSKQRTIIPYFNVRQNCFLHKSTPTLFVLVQREDEDWPIAEAEDSSLRAGIFKAL